MCGVGSAALLGSRSREPGNAGMTMCRMTSPNTFAPSGTSAGGAPLIRAYRDGDDASLLDCIAELQDAERAIDARLRRGRAIAPDYLVAMLEECRQWAGQIFLLEVDGAVAGFTTVYTHVPFERLDEPPGDYAIVAELLVRREYRRRGYARALLAHGERYAASQGATELRIGVLSDNTAARALYLDYGFRPYIETLAKPLDVFHSQPRLVGNGDVTIEEPSGSSEAS
jgi:ribosomal protein S18 acetylase RimI-like enzyme